MFGLGIAVACAPVGGITSPTTAVQATASPQPPRIGTVVRAGNWQYRVMQVDTAKSLRWGSSDSGVLIPKGIWVAVMFDLTNMGSRNFTLNTWDLELWAGGGIKYDSAGFDSSLYSHSIGQAALGEQMPPGVTTRFTVLFDVAPGTTGMKLHLVQGGPDIRLEGLDTSAADPSPVVTNTGLPPAPATAVPAGTPQVFKDLNVRGRVNMDVPWDQLGASVSSGSDARATTLAGALGQSYPIAVRVNVQAAAPGVTVFVLIPLQGFGRLSNGSDGLYPPYSRWSLLSTSLRQTYFLNSIKTAAATYPGLRINLYAFRYDGAPLGEGTNTPNLTVNAVLPGF